MAQAQQLEEDIPVDGSDAGYFAPNPAAVAASEANKYVAPAWVTNAKQWLGTDLEPVYPTQTISAPRGGGTRQIAIPGAAPIGYRFDNGKSQYVYISNELDAGGQPVVTNVQNRTNGINEIISFAAMIPGPWQIACQAYMAVKAVESGNIAAGAAQLAGLGGFAEVQQAIQMADAIDKGNVANFALSLLQNSTVAKAAGTTMLTDTLSVADAAKSAVIASKVAEGTPESLASAVTMAGQLTKSSDLKTAGAALTLTNAINTAVRTNNFIGLFGAVDNFANATGMAGVQSLTGTQKITGPNGQNLITGADSSATSTLAAPVFNANGMKLDTVNDAAKAASDAGFTTFKYGDSTYNITGSTGTSGAGSSTVTGATGTDTVTAATGKDTVTGGTGLTQAQIDAALAEGSNISEGEKVSVANQIEIPQVKPGEAMFTVSNPMTAGQRNQVVETAISGAKTFDDAYAAAREGYGKGKTFTWNGQNFSTSTRAEDPSLAAASDNIRMSKLVDNVGSGGGRGSYAGYNAADEAAWKDLISEKTDSDGAKIVRATTTLEHLAATGAVGLGEQAQAFAQAFSLATGETFANGLQKYGTMLEQWGKDRTGIQISKDIKDTESKINEIKGLGSFWDQSKAIGRLVLDKPYAIANYVGQEVAQEAVPTLAGVTAAGLAIWGGVGVGAALTVGAIASATSDALETLGSNGKEAYDKALARNLKAGMSATAAESQARNEGLAVGGIAAAITLPAEVLADRLLLGAYFNTLKGSVGAYAARYGSTLATESIGEGIETMGQSLTAKYAETGGKPLTMKDVYSASGDALFSMVIAPGATGAIVSGAAVKDAVVVAKDYAGNNVTFAELTSGSNKNIDYSTINGNAVVATTPNGGGITLSGYVADGLENTGLNASGFSGLLPASVTSNDAVVATAANGQTFTLQQLENVTNNNSGIDATTFLNDVATMTPAQIVATYTSEVLQGNAKVDTSARETALSTKPVISFENTATVLATNNNGTSLVQNDTTGATSTVKTVGDAAVGSKVNLVTSAATGDVVAVASTTPASTVSTTADTGSTVASTTAADAATTVVTDPNAAVVTDPNAAVVTDPNASVVTDPNAAVVTDPNAAVVTDPNTTVVTDPNATVVTDPNSSVVTDPNAVVVTDPNATVVTDPNSSVVTDPNAAVVTDPNTAVVTDPNATVVTDPNVTTNVTTNVNDTQYNNALAELQRIRDSEAAAAAAAETQRIAAEKVAAEKVKAEKDAAEKAKRQRLGQQATQESSQSTSAEVPSTQLKTGLTTTDPGSAFEGPLAKFLKQVKEDSYVNKPTPQPQQAEQMNPPQQQPSSYYNYGQEQNIDELLAKSQLPETGVVGAKRGGLATPLMAAGGGTRYGKYAGGGLNMVNHSGKDRVDFRTGDAVTGPGDGQSDDIPAMLADGEFVFPADVVAALGNGSTKAGSDKLYDMMHGIRARARSSHPKELPPPAKSPLEYLKRRKKARS